MFEAKWGIDLTQHATRSMESLWLADNPNPGTVRRCGFRNRPDRLYSSRSAPLAGRRCKQPAPWSRPTHRTDRGAGPQSFALHASRTARGHAGLADHRALVRRYSYYHRDTLGRHHPAHALRCSLLLAVVRSQISSPPSADRASAAALDVAQNFFGLEAINRQRALMMAGPIAFALAETIDKQLANAVSAD
jgi:hypothetical protein